MADNVRNDGVQHGIDDNPNDDAKKGAALGGAGGVVTGALAGSAAGPVGTVVGAVVGGLAGAGASGLAVGAVDKVDNDNNISGVGGGVTTDTGNAATTVAGAVTPNADVTPGNNVPGVQTGGTTLSGAPDTRGITEKAADAVTGDRTDDKTGRTV